MRAVCLTLCLSTLAYTISPAAMAQDETKRTSASMSDEEDAALAARAAQTPQLENFRGGDALGPLISLLVIVALVAIIYYFVVKAPHRSYPMQPQPNPQP